jgi:hypothetical protein
MLLSVRPEGDGLRATFRNDLTDETVEIESDQVVVEGGTYPLDEVFQALKDKALNRGVTDIEALLRVQPQPHQPDGNGGFVLYRVGDAVSSRSLHAALLDAYRIALTL